ncbi:hypothetical protein AAF712_015297, partial [Marasmius tenuissimus]
MGSLAGPSTLAGRLDATTSGASCPRNLARDNAESQRSGGKTWRHNGGRPHTRSYDNTQNNGDRNRTYNRSRVSEQHRYDRQSNSNAEVHVHVQYERESSLPARRESTSLPLERPHRRQSAASLSRGKSSFPSTCRIDIPSQGLSLTPTSPIEEPCAQQTTPLPNGESLSRSIHAKSQDALLSHTSSSPSDESNLTRQTKGKDRTWTRSERYESLLLRCKLGFPLWVPSPRCTPDGEYYMPEIGDVGVLSHGLPFNTLFNIAQPLSSLANKDGVPEGFDPPCDLKLRWITIKERKNPSQIPLFQPRGAILDQKSGLAIDGLSRCIFSFYAFTCCPLNSRLHPTRRVFTFDLSEEEGALLMLPCGSILRNLESTARLEERARLQWRQWYDYANDQMNLGDGRALYLVTGVERCRTWAMAAWDACQTCDRLGSIELTVDSNTGACSWGFPPARCSMEVSDSPTTGISQSNQETVFIRGFRIDISDGGVSLRPPGLSSRPAKEKDGNDGNPSPGGSGSQGPSPPSGDSSSDPSPSMHPSSHGSGRPGASESQFYPLDLPIGKSQILELELDMIFSGNEEDSITHPCKIINNFAFGLISKTKPALLDAGYAALSHDEDWISIVEDSDEDFPSNVEIVQRICSKFKFTIDADVIYTVSMNDLDREVFERSKASRLQSQGSVTSVTVLVVFAEDNNSISPASYHFEASLYEPPPLARSNGGSASLVNSYENSLELEQECDHELGRNAGVRDPHTNAIRLPIRAPSASADDSRIKFIWPENEEAAMSFAVGFPAEHASADFSIAPDGSFVETSSGAAAMDLKRKYDSELGRNASVRSLYAITAFINQHGRRMFRIGPRDLSAPATAEPTAEDQNINCASSSSSATPLSPSVSLSTQTPSTAASSRPRSGRLSPSYMDQGRRSQNGLDPSDPTSNHLMSVSARPSKSPLLRNPENLLQEAAASKQALQLSRASLARAQKETSDAFLRYTACLDAERQARQSVANAEKRRDDVSGYLFASMLPPTVPDSGAVSALLSPNQGMAAQTSCSPYMSAMAHPAGVDQQRSRHSSVSLEETQAAHALARYHTEAQTQADLKSSRNNAKPLEWGEAEPQAVYAEPMHMEDHTGRSLGRKHSRTWENAGQMQ